MNSPGAARSDEIVRGILASYEFTVDEVPTKDDLERMTPRIQEIEGSPVRTE